MPGIIISTDEISVAPPVARLWLERKFTWVLRQRHVSEGALPEPHFSPMEEGQGTTQVGGDASRSEGDAVPAVSSTEDTIPSEAQGSVTTLDLHRLIAERAYEIWECEGRPHGHDLIHWKTAEQEIMDSVKRA